MTEAEEQSHAKMVDLESISLENGIMTSNWYTGNWSLNWMRLTINQLDVIEAGAFKSLVFQYMTILELYAKRGCVAVHDGAFVGLQHLMSFQFGARRVSALPAGLFDLAFVKISIIHCIGWPNDVNLSEMFANEVYYMLKLLLIKNVQLPQTKFRRLAADNFTSFRRL